VPESAFTASISLPLSGRSPEALSPVHPKVFLDIYDRLRLLELPAKPVVLAPEPSYLSGLISDNYFSRLATIKIPG